MRTMACGIEFDYNKLAGGIVAAVADIDMGREKGGRFEYYFIDIHYPYIWLVVVYLFFRFLLLLIIPDMICV